MTIIKVKNIFMQYANILDIYFIIKSFSVIKFFESQNVSNVSLKVEIIIKNKILWKKCLKQVIFIQSFLNLF